MRTRRREEYKVRASVPEGRSRISEERRDYRNWQRGEGNRKGSSKKKLVWRKLCQHFLASKGKGRSRTERMGVI